MPPAPHWDHIKHHLDTLTLLVSNSQYKPEILKLMHNYMIVLMSGRFFIMNATEYWLFSHQFSIWNAAAAALQF